MSHRLSSLIDTLRSYGIGPGDKIAASLRNGQLLVDLLFAAWHLGANLCPLNFRLPQRQIDSALKRLSPKLYVDASGFTPKNGGPSSIYSSLFLFTSGSTGTPKIAVLSSQNLFANAESILHRLDLKEGDRWLLSLPLFHVGGIGILLRCLFAKAKTTFDTHDPLITHLSYVPTQLYRATPLYKKLRCLLLGGAPVHQIPEHLPAYLTYGLTEMGSMVAACLHPPKIDNRYYLGHPLPNREIKIAEDGEILVKGAPLFQGYWENGHLSLPLKDGWFATGDLGRYCPKLGLAILGRKDWQFISGGENIQPEEIEQELLSCPTVQEAIVLPKADPEFGFRPIAFVKTTDPHFSLDAMRKILLDRLPKYKIPTAMHHLEEFPKKGLKVDRLALHQLASSLL